MSNWGIFTEAQIKTMALWACAALNTTKYPAIQINAEEQSITYRWAIVPAHSQQDLEMLRRCVASTLGPEWRVSITNEGENQ